VKKFDKLLKLYQEKFHGYCLYKYEKWQHNHKSNFKEDHALNFQYHDQISANSLNELIAKAKVFQTLIESDLKSTETIEYKDCIITLNESESGITAEIKCNGKKLNFTLSKTFVMSNALEKAKIFIDGWLS
jgi:hypothetical protein